VREKPPEIDPFSTSGLATFSVVFDVNTPFPPNVKPPVNVVVAPIFSVPPNEKPFASTRAAVEELVSVPAVITNAPLPSAASSPTRTVPAVIVTPPLKLFAPPNTKIPDPAFDTENAPPEITPPKVTGFVGLAIVSARLDVNVPAPLKVNAPPFVGSPKITVPPKE
jgi:hypothetical protein